MDGQRFDDLTRGLARGLSRRQVLKGLASTAAGGTLIGLGVTRAGTVRAAGPPSTGPSTCAQAGGSCATDSDCCQGSCSTDTNICYCSDESRPALGCTCVTGSANPCGDSTLLCCSSSSIPGAPGTCTSAAVGCTPTNRCAFAGDACLSDSDCCEGSCGTDTHTCYCTDPSRPALGCGCNSGTQNPCGDSTLICCTAAGTPPGGHGTCTSAAVGCTSGGNANPPSTCAYAGDACSQDSDCCEGSCGTDTKTCFCTDSSIPALGCGCNSGTQNPCGDANLICCTAAGTPPGGHGTCAKASVGCSSGGGQAHPPITTLPNTGSGPRGGTSGFFPAVALVGAGVALAGRHVRRRQTDADSKDS